MENRQYEIEANRRAERREGEAAAGQREQQEDRGSKGEREREIGNERESEKVSYTTPLLVRIRHFQLQLKDYFFFGGRVG